MLGKARSVKLLGFMEDWWKIPGVFMKEVQVSEVS
jgi:hypothetical protein